MNKLLFVRFDDIDSKSPELDKVLSLFLSLKIPVNVGVIPKTIDQRTVEYLNGLCKKYPKLIEIDQHGYQHRKLKKGELDGYAEKELKHYLESGFNVLEGHFHSNFSKILTVPWHAHLENMEKVASEVGYRAISINNRSDWTAKIFYTIGKILGRNTLLGYHISYHGHSRNRILSEISPTLDMMKSYKGEGTHESMEVLRHKFQRLRNQKQSLGMLIHPQYYVKDDTLKELKRFFEELKKDKQVRFIRMSEIISKRNIITQSDQERYYNNNSYYFKHLRKKHWEQYFDSILRLFHKIPEADRKNATILEVGSGSGNLIDILVKNEKCRADQIYALDVSAIGLKMHKNGIKVRGDATRLPFANNSFNICISSDTIEHILDYEICLKEMYRVVKPGGYVVVRTQNYDCPFLSFDGNDLTIYKRIKADRDAVSRTSSKRINKIFRSLPGRIIYFESWASFNWRVPVLRAFNYIPYFRFIGGTCSLLFQKDKKKGNKLYREISFACPKCRTTLTEDGKGLKCSKCSTDFKRTRDFVDLYIKA